MRQRAGGTLYDVPGARLLYEVLAILEGSPASPDYTTRAICKQKGGKKMIGLYYQNRNPVTEGHRVKTFKELALALIQINPDISLREVLDKWAEIQERR